MRNFLRQKKQFLLYCAIGGCGTAVDFSCYTLLLSFAGLHYQTANAAGYACGTLLAFSLNARFNFRITDRIALRLLSFLGVAGLGYLTSAGLLHVLIGDLSFDKYLAKLATLVVVVVMQYNLNRLLAFRKTV